MKYLKERKAHMDALILQGINDPELFERRSGRSTGCALDIISKAIRDPNHPVKFYDHYSNDRNVLKHVTAPLIRDILDRLGLEGFTMNYSNLTLTYSFDIM